MKTIWMTVCVAGLASSLMAQSEDVIIVAQNRLATAATTEIRPTFNLQTMDFVSGQLVSGVPVKGAPYSAEAVNETIQTLADGNRIVQRTSAMQYRDSEGRERREETSAMGAIFISDPVAGTRYTLHPETRSADRGPMPVFNVAPIGAGGLTISSSDPVTLKGTISEVEWTNPMAWIGVNVQGPDGKAVNWRCATAPPNVLIGLGLTRNSAKLNDPITINGRRAAGSNTCEASSVTLASGTFSMPPAVPRAGTIASVAGVAGRGPVTVALAGRAPIPPGGRGGPANDQFFMVTPGNVFTWSGNEKDTKVEQLGKMFLEGVQAEGTRTTTTIPAGEIGNERPINIVDERWYSPDLQMTVMTKHSDPRNGETSFQLKNINRSSPPPYLFEVPADYTVNAGGGRAGPGTVRIIHDTRE